MNVVLLSTYELGRQPFGLASPAAWLRREGARVTCLDLAVEDLDEAAVRAADLVAFYVPMHTATRIAVSAVRRIRELKPRVHVCLYGLYAPLNEAFLRTRGADTVLGGEFETGLVELLGRLGTSRETAAAVQPEPVVRLERQRFLVPDRAGLPPLESYAQLVDGAGGARTVGYTEASRGCKHLCRHCPVVPIYHGALRIVERSVVLQDIAQQVAAGAQHITFGDPDFLNAPGHALAVVEDLHSAHPQLTYDVTVKVEHLLRHARHLPRLRETGCVLVTSAAESADDDVLRLLDKGHTRADFVTAVSLCRQAGLALSPTFVPFTPWSTLEGYVKLLELVMSLDLVHHVAPIQLAIRLLVPHGSRLLELLGFSARLGPFDEESLVYPWRHEDPRVDALQQAVEEWVHDCGQGDKTRRETFAGLWELAGEATGHTVEPFEPDATTPRAAIPYLNEPWYC